MIITGTTTLVICIVAGFVGLWILFYFIPVGLWFTALISGVHISLLQLILMRWRKVPPQTIVRAMIEAHKAGLQGIKRDDLEAHYLAGGHVEAVVHALVSAEKANIDLNFKMATAIDLAGRDVFEAVQMSVNPKVIDTPPVTAVAKDGIQLIAKARVTVRANIKQLVGGAGANLAKCLLYALNGGVDEVTKKQVGPKYRPVEGDYLDYDDVMAKYTDMMEWLADIYVNTLNVIHYMHDKYCYERAQMALHDRDVRRYFATGMAGLSVVADSLSAIKYAKVKVIRDEDGIITDFETTGDFPKYGNDDDRVDSIATELVHKFMTMIRRHHTYRDGFPTMSVLTITSNVTYGKATGNTPDGRRKGQPFAPGANPMHNRDTHGAVASLSSVAKLPFMDSQDGISNTFTIIPGALGKEDKVFAGDIDLDLK